MGKIRFSIPGSNLRYPYPVCKKCMFLLFCVCFRIIARDTLTEAEGVGNVVTLVRDDDVDVIFGNPSSTSKCTGPEIIKLLFHAQIN